MDIPHNQAVFDLKMTGAESGTEYEGRFTVRCTLNIMQRHALELEKTRLLGNYAAPTDGLMGYATVLANLRVKIVDAPEWWKQSVGGFSLEDEDVIMAIYNKTQEAENTWREKLKEKGKKALEATSAPLTQ